MANKNTKRARSEGRTDGKTDNEVFRGQTCDTRWNAERSKRTSPTDYWKVKIQRESQQD